MKKDQPAQAVALSYDGKNAPLVVAKGRAELAQQIIALAEENGVMIHEDPVLLEVLYRLELGEEIPELLYLAIAQIIAFAYSLQNKIPEGFNQEGR